MMKDHARMGRTPCGRVHKQEPQQGFDPLAHTRPQKTFGKWTTYGPADSVQAKTHPISPPSRELFNRLGSYPILSLLYKTTLGRAEPRRLSTSTTAVVPSQLPKPPAEAQHGRLLPEALVAFRTCVASAAAVGFERLETP